MSMRSTSAQVWSAIRHQQIWRNQSPAVLCFNHRRHQYCTYWPLIDYAILNNIHISCLRSYFHSFLLSSLNRNVVMTCMLTSITWDLWGAPHHLQEPFCSIAHSSKDIVTWTMTWSQGTFVAVRGIAIGITKSVRFLIAIGGHLFNQVILCQTMINITQMIQQIKMFF